MRAAIYARVSSAGQRDRHTIGNQLGTLPAFVASQGWELAGTYVDDGRSAAAGKLDAREGFARLLRDADARRFDLVVVVDVDRLTRTDSMEERAAVLGPLQRNGIDIVTPSGGRQDLRSFLGEFYVTLQALVAAEENRKRAARTMAGKQRAIADGKKPGSTTPYGYRYAREEGWSLVPDQAEVIREVFRRVAAGESCRRLDLDMAARGVTRPRGTRWGRGFAFRIVRSTTYRGELLVSKARGQRIPVPPIVDPDLWHAAQATVDRLGRHHVQRTENVYLLQGLATCDGCGAHVGVCSHGRRPDGRWRSPSTYVCTERARPRRGARCGMPHHRAEVLDAQVWEGLVGVLARPDFLDEAVARVRGLAADDGRTWQGDLREAKARLARLERAQEGILARFRRGLIPERVLDSELDSAARERRMLEMQIAGAERAGAGLRRADREAADLAQAVREARGRVDRADARERQRLVRALLGSAPVIVGATEVRAMFSLSTQPIRQAHHPRWPMVRATNPGNLLDRPLIVRVA